MPRCAIELLGEVRSERAHNFSAELFHELLGMAENSFGGMPGPRYLYDSPTHAEAKSSLIVGLDRRTRRRKEHGGVSRHEIAGKQQCPSGIRFGWQVLPGRGNFLRAHYSHSTDEPVQALRWLQRPFPAGLFVDDGENLSTDAWHDLQLLATMSPADRHKVIVIVGRPEVKDALAPPDLGKLEQAIFSRFSLQRLSNVEIENYVACRLRFVQAFFPQLLFQPCASTWKAILV